MPSALNPDMDFIDLCEARQEQRLRLLLGGADVGDQSREPSIVMPDACAGYGWLKAFEGQFCWQGTGLRAQLELCFRSRFGCGSLGPGQLMGGVFSGPPIVVFDATGTEGNAAAWHRYYVLRN